MQGEKEPGETEVKKGERQAQEMIPSEGNRFRKRERIQGGNEE